jgi:hypothetical protein
MYSRMSCEATWGLIRHSAWSIDPSEPGFVSEHDPQPPPTACSPSPGQGYSAWEMPFFTRAEPQDRDWDETGVASTCASHA